MLGSHDTLVVISIKSVIFKTEISTYIRVSWINKEVLM